LLRIPQREGLLFEMNNYASWTIEAMASWNYNLANILELKFEEIMLDYDRHFRQIFESLEFSSREVNVAMRVASGHNILKMKANELEQIEHVSAPVFPKWKHYFEELHEKEFLHKFGDVLNKLGYEPFSNLKHEF
jgi:hypothetical protein